MLDKLELLDRELFLAINGWHAPMFDNIMYYVSQIWVFAPVFVYWLYMVFNRYGLKKLLILIGFLGLLVLLTDQTSNITKHAIKRYRPTHNLEIQSKVHTVNEYKGGLYGFFSGHSTNTFGVAMLLFLIFRKESLVFRLLFFGWAALTAYSRIYLGVHYPSDIFVGFVVGIFWGYVVYRLIQFTFKQQFHETVEV
ncbi:MAG TPA: phosphatase PAP2 family protein [Bacteroidia bacterium]|nr:phosphatase PAP2 family protein [Bacteroidia bacterium]